MDDDVSPQGNNDVTPQVTPTTSETQQPYNQAATARQTPSLAPTNEMTSQRSHDAETYAEAALGGDTACGLMCSHRAAYRTEVSSCILASQSPPKDISSESTGRSLAPGLPDNALTNEVPPETAPAPETLPAPAAVTDTSTQTTTSPRKLQDVAPPPAARYDQAEISASCPRLGKPARPNRGEPRDDPGGRHNKQTNRWWCDRDLTWWSSLQSRHCWHSDTAHRHTHTPRDIRCHANTQETVFGSLKSSIDTWLAKLPTQTRTTSVTRRTSAF